MKILMAKTSVYEKGSMFKARECLLMRVSCFKHVKRLSNGETRILNKSYSSMKGVRYISKFKLWYVVLYSYAYSLFSYPPMEIMWHQEYESITSQER
jgi:hypothetical protein